MKAVLFLMMLAAPLAVRAEDWTMVDGKTFKNVKVLSHDDGYVTIMDDEGGARVMLTELPPALRQQFGFDPAKASACVAATVAADIKDRAALASERQQQDAAVTPQAPPSAASSPAPAPTSAQAPPAAAAAPTPTAPAGDLLENGDFSRGDSNWQGDGSPARTGKGMVVNLNSSSWTRIYQNFTANQGTVYSIALYYKFSPGIGFSKDAADYAEVDKRIDISGFEKFSSWSVGVGDFYVTIGDPDSPRIVCENISANLASTDVQSFIHTFPEQPVTDNKIVAVAFPPGSGTVTIQSVAVTSK